VNRPASRPVGALARRYPDILFSVATDRPVVALSLDDGPDPAVTAAVLDVMGAARCRATFFLHGEPALRHAALVGRAVAEGHELGNHQWRDRPCRALPLPEFVEDLERTHEVLSRHAPVGLMRPASGLIRRDQRAALRERGYRCVLGSVYLLDAHLRQGRWLAAAMARLAAPGAILVLHEGPGRGRSPRMLAALISSLRARGLEPTTVGELLGPGGPA
jgi:peptidoglycan-N-acetylglucosamine deacetylase